MDILDDTGVSKLSAKVYFKMNSSFKQIDRRGDLNVCFVWCLTEAASYIRHARGENYRHEGFCLFQYILSSSVSLIC